MLLSFALAAMLMFNASMPEVNAAEKMTYSDSKIEMLEGTVGDLPEGYFDNLKMSRAVLSDCTIVIGFGDSGMRISIFTGASDIVPVLGVKDIKVEQKVWYGWKTVAVASGGQFTDTSGMSYGVTYTNAIKGETYRVSCVHYADLTYDGVESFTEGTNCTGEFVFTY